MALSGIISEIKRDNVENRDFFHTHLASDILIGGGVLLEYGHPLWYGKTSMVWLPDDEKKFGIFGCHGGRDECCCVRRVVLFAE